MKLVFLFLIILSSVSASAVTYSKWAVPASKDYPPMDKSKNPDEKYIPPLSSQDTLGICFASAAATALNFEQCKAQDTDCKSQPDDQRISTLGIARYGQLPKQGDIQDDRDYKALPDGGNSSKVMKRATRMMRLPSEKCASLEKILSKTPMKGQEATRAQEAIWNSFRKLYDSYKKAKEEGCNECLSDIFATAKDNVNKNYALSEDEKINDRVNQARVLAAFGSDTYEEAFNSLLYPPQCGDEKNGIKLIPKLRTDIYPMFVEDPVTPKDLINKTVSILESKHPVVLENICIVDCGTEKQGLHSVVVVGYRKICKKKSADCRYALKIQNSWGQAWQRQNNDGWLEADALFKHVKADSPALSWFTPRE